MRLIAKKPCSFNGQVFYIGDEIPSEFVINPKAQEKLGVIAIAAGGEMYERIAVFWMNVVGQVEFAVPINQKDGDDDYAFHRRADMQSCRGNADDDGRRQRCDQGNLRMRRR